MQKIDKSTLAAMRIAGSGLMKPFEEIVDCVRDLAGIQAQAQQFAELAIFNRTADAGGMESLFASGRIVKIWSNRMTVHLHTAEDWQSVNHLYGYRNNHIRKAWSDKVEEYEKVMDALQTEIASVGEMEKDRIREIIDRVAGHIQEPYRDRSIIMSATMEGTVFGVAERPAIRRLRHRRLAGIEDGQFTLWGPSRCDHWKQEAIRKYFQTYGPATLTDFCHWSGLNRCEVADIFEIVKPDLVPYEYEGQILYAAAPAQVGADEVAGRVRMLGKFDPLMLSYADKGWIADGQQQKAVWRPAAHVEAVVIEGSSLAATWRYSCAGRKMDIDIFPLVPIRAATKRKIERESNRIAGFMGMKLRTINYTEQ